MLVVTWPLESVRPLAGSKVTPGAALNSTNAPATAAPCSSFTCTTRGCGNAVPACAICFPPLDSTMAVPNAVGLGSGANAVLCEQDATSAAISNITNGQRVTNHFFALATSDLPPPFCEMRNAVRARASSSLMARLGSMVPGRRACGFFIH